MRGGLQKIWRMIRQILLMCVIEFIFLAKFFGVGQGAAIKVILDTGLEDPPAHQDPRPLESEKVGYQV